MFLRVTTTTTNNDRKYLSTTLWQTLSDPERIQGEMTPSEDAVGEFASGFLKRFPLLTVVIPREMPGKDFGETLRNDSYGQLPRKILEEITAAIPRIIPKNSICKNPRRDTQQIKEKIARQNYQCDCWAVAGRR